jgi:hypothetical protein
MEQNFVHKLDEVLTKAEEKRLKAKFNIEGDLVDAIVKHAMIYIDPDGSETAEDLIEVFEEDY